MSDILSFAFSAQAGFPKLHCLVLQRSGHGMDSRPARVVLLRCFVRLNLRNRLAEELSHFLER